MYLLLHFGKICNEKFQVISTEIKLIGEYVFVKVKMQTWYVMTYIMLYAYVENEFFLKHVAVV